MSLVKPPHLLLILAAALPLAGFAKTEPSPAPVATPQSISQEHPALAVLEAHCVSCHNPEKAKGDLLIHSAEALAKGGDSGPAIVTKNAAKSELLARILLPEDEDDAMPPRAVASPTTKRQPYAIGSIRAPPSRRTASCGKDLRLIYRKKRIQPTPRTSSRSASIRKR